MATIPRSEREAALYEISLVQYINKRNGRFLRAEDGSLHLILQDRRISLSFDRNNYNLARLMLDSCGVSSLSPGAQAALQRLQVIAEKGAGRVVVRSFSALSADHSRLYVPVSGDQLLEITAESIRPIINGTNRDNFWVEQPRASGGAHSFQYQQAPPAEGLARFEKLLVNTQSCRVAAMRWLIAMHEAFFPFVRDVCRARFLLTHIGGTQQGKTTGAQRFTQLLGLGEVTGDYSVAALSNQPDIGLLVMDNKEQANFTQSLIDFCLFLSTGARRGRSTAEGKERPQSTSRPVGVITSIEGAWKPELQARCIEVSYAINGTKVDRDHTEDEILQHRNEILAAMLLVLQAWLKCRGAEQVSSKSPLLGFERHFTTLAELLFAYAEIAGKPKGWAQQIVDEWASQIGRPSADADIEDDLEFPIIEALTTHALDGGEKIIFEARSGALHVTDSASLLASLRRHCQRDTVLPRNATGLGRRLRSARFRTLKFLDEDLAPQLTQLKRTRNKRPIGFFRPDESDGEADDNDKA